MLKKHFVPATATNPAKRTHTDTLEGCLDCPQGIQPIGASRVMLALWLGPITSAIAVKNLHSFLQHIDARHINLHPNSAFPTIRAAGDWVVGLSERILIREREVHKDMPESLYYELLRVQHNATCEERYSSFLHLLNQYFW